MDPTPSPRRKLDGKVAVVTGGASGIGEATARHFAAHGARAVVIADIQDEKGQQVAASIGPPDRCAYFHCDVTEEIEVKALVESTVQTYGSLDVMFSNAGIVSRRIQNILDLDMCAVDSLFAVNVRGTAACVKHAGRAMKDLGVRGSIVCTASVAAVTGIDGPVIDYTMSKHAVVGLVRAASVQLGAHGVRVNCVSPSYVATPMVCGAMEMSEEETERYFEPTTSLSGVLKAKHVADAVVFLASEDSEFVTGHNLVVDGGFRPSPSRIVGPTSPTPRAAALDPLQ